MQIKSIALAVLCGVVANGAGCSIFDSKQNKSSDKSWSVSNLWKKGYQTPSTISVIWSPDVLTMTGKPPTRGFGGRVFFYNARSQAVPVEGELIVHGYRGDPMVGESEQVKADKKFAFTAEQLTSHFSPSELGASYSIWIPWDGADGYRTEVTLIPTFKVKDGGIVQGAPAKLNLPGRSLDGKDNAASSHTQTVSYTSATLPTNELGRLPEFQKQHAQYPQPTTEPTTIDLPPLGSIGRPRNKPQSSVQGFTLGNMQNQPVQQASSASYGASQASYSQPAQSPLQPVALQPPPGSTDNSAQPTQITPAQNLDGRAAMQPAGELKAAGTPLRFQPWQSQLK